MYGKSAFWTMTILLTGILAGCGDSGSESPQILPFENVPDHHVYVLHSPYHVTTDFNYSNPVTDFDLNTLQDYIDWEYDKLDNGLLDYIGGDFTGMIDAIDAPVVLENGYAETRIHARKGEVLTLSDIDELRDEILGQYADGWGEGLEQMHFTITTAGEELYVSLYGGSNWSIHLYGKYIYSSDPGTGEVIVTPSGP